MKLNSILDKTGSLGVVVSALGCAACFPALATIGSALGLGFLSQFEGILINNLMPLFALLAIAINLNAAWTHHYSVLRALSGIAGPAMILATLYLFWSDGWSTYLFYLGLVWMLVVAGWDVLMVSRRGASDTDVILESTITCPVCGHSKTETMPTDACQWFYQCEHCQALLKPKRGDCCVFCSYATVPCPPIQLERKGVSSKTGCSSSCCEA